MKRIVHDPAALARRRREKNIHTSREYIERFNKLDDEPEEEAEERTKQIVKLCRKILPDVTRGASDDHVIRLHESYMAGLF